MGYVLYKILGNYSKVVQIVQHSFFLKGSIDSNLRILYYKLMKNINLLTIIAFIAVGTAGATTQIMMPSDVQAESCNKPDD